MRASKHVSAKREAPSRRHRQDGDEAIDYSDIPDLGDDEAFWAQAPVEWPPKKSLLSLRLDDDIVTWFRKGGRGYQTRINQVLRTYVATRRKVGTEDLAATKARWRSDARIARSTKKR